MWNLLKIEWYILSKSKVFWIITSLCIAGMIACPFTLYSFVMSDEQTRFDMLEAAFSFPIVFNTISCVELFPVHLLCVYFISIICNEFEFDTFRLHIQAGTQKMSLWHSKMLLAVVFSFFATILVLLLSFVFGFINDNEYDIIFNFNSLESLVLFLFQTLAFFSFATTLALIIKKTGPTIIVYILWFVFFERIFAQVINGLFHMYPLGSLLPGKSIEDLTYMKAFTGFIIRQDSYRILKTISAFFWIVLSVITNLMLFKKAKY